MLYSLVDRIEVHASERDTDGKKSQQIDIYFSFLPECPTAVTDGSGAAETDEEKQKGDEKIDQWLRQKRREDLVTATGSEKGRQILEHFEDYIPAFKKIIPKDYEKMIAAIAALEGKGESREQAEIAAFNAAVKH